MKPEIIIAISFAQSSEKSIVYSVLDATGTIFAGLVMLAIPILIVLLIVLKKKGKLTGSLFKKILAIFGLFFLAIIITAIISSNFLSDEEKAERDKRIEEQEDKLNQAEILQQQIIEQQKAKLEKQKELESQKSLQAEKLRGLPVSCDGVDTTESWLYPTADQCAKDMGKGFYNWCLEKAKKEVSAEDAEARAGLCMGAISIRFGQLCADPVIGSQEFCLMNSMQDLYRRLVVN